MTEEELASLSRFIFEIGQLKRTPRSGWLKLGVSDPESVADHSFRTAVLGFLLGKLEGRDPYRVAGYCLFHDVAESRTLDLDWLAQKYLKKKDYLSSDAVSDQIDGLPEDLKSVFEDLFKDPGGSDNLELISRDADLLELLFQALEITHQGNPLAKKWFYNTLPFLKTDSAKRIGDYLEKMEQAGKLDRLASWWEEVELNSDLDG